MSKYAEYEEKLLGLIKQKPQGFIELAIQLSKENNEFCTPWCTDTSRVTDRRLQHLRKTGKIRHRGVKWYAV